MNGAATSRRRRSGLVAAVASVLAVAVNWPLLAGMVGDLPGTGWFGSTPTGAGRGSAQSEAADVDLVLARLDELVGSASAPPPGWSPLAGDESIDDPFLLREAPTDAEPAETSDSTLLPLAEPRVSLILITAARRTAVLDGEPLGLGASTTWGTLTAIESDGVTFRTATGRELRVALGTGARTETTDAERTSGSARATGPAQATGSDQAGGSTPGQDTATAQAAARGDR